MLQLFARAPFFSREDLQHSSRGRGAGGSRGAPQRARVTLWRYPRYIRSACIGIVSGSYFFYRVVDVAILELLNYFHFD